jgi:hypothetical protein
MNQYVSGAVISIKKRILADSEQNLQRQLRLVLKDESTHDENALNFNSLARD